MEREPPRASLIEYETHPRASERLHEGAPNSAVQNVYGVF